MKRLSYLYEIPAFFLILFAVRSTLPDPAAFDRADPNPYWLGVLLFALRYGLSAGTASGAAAAAFYLGGCWLGGDHYRFEDPEFYALPGLFILAGAAVGRTVDALAKLRRDSEEKLAELSDRNHALAAELKTQQKETRAVEQQVVSQMSSLVTLYQGSRELGSLDRKVLFDGILDFFTEALQATETALYRKDEDRWVLYRQKGWPRTDAHPEALGFTQGLVGKAGSEGRVVSLRDWVGTDVEKAWEGRDSADAIMAGPLRREDGEVIGVFSVQDMPFLRFNSASLNLMTLLLDWADEAIAKSLYFEELKSRSILDEVYNVYNEHYFRSRAEQEFARSKTYSLPFSMLLLSIPGLSFLPLQQQVNFLRAVSRLLQQSCRTIDVVAKFPAPEIPFAVLMMTATAERAAELAAAIHEAYRKLELAKPLEGAQALELGIGVGSYAASMATLEEMIAQAKKGLA